MQSKPAAQPLHTSRRSTCGRKEKRRVCSRKIALAHPQITTSKPWGSHNAAATRDCIQSRVASAKKMCDARCVFIVTHFPVFAAGNQSYILLVLLDFGYIKNYAVGLIPLFVPINKLFVQG